MGMKREAAQTELSMCDKSKATTSVLETCSTPKLTCMLMRINHMFVPTLSQGLYTSNGEAVEIREMLRGRVHT